MDSQTKDMLEKGGIGVDSLLERCMGSEALMLRLLKKFPADASFAKLCEAMEKGDDAAAVEASHTLKGVAGNLSLGVLFPLLEKQVHSLRAGDRAAAQALMPEIERAHAAALRAVEGLA